jgi:mRNA-degrading endonuclease RelE of RelBE toxin-antitoxin system
MRYELVAIPACLRALKKLPQDVQDHLFAEFQRVQEHPLSSPQLQGKVSFLHSLHTRYKNSDYRTAYQVDEKHKRIILWYAASRENFYKQLERLIRK